MIPEILISHNPILLFAQGLAQLGEPSDAVEGFIAMMRVILSPFLPVLHI